MTAMKEYDKRAGDLRGFPLGLDDKLGDPLGADRMDGLSQVFDAPGKPGKFILADPVMLGLCRASDYAERA